MISMRFRHGDQEAVLVVERGTLLRDVQKDLCAFFGQRFPRMKANLQVEGVVYDNFGDAPFAHCGDKALCMILKTICACDYMIASTLFICSRRRRA